MRDKDSYIAYFLSEDRLGALLKARFVSLSSDECIYEYDVDLEHYNPGGILHGGALYTVMDSSQGMLAHYILDSAYKTAATGTATIKYLKPLRSGTIRIHTVLDSRQERKYFFRSIATDSDGAEVAILDEVFIGIPA